MLDYSISKPEGILVLEPQAPLTKEDFSGLGTEADSYLSSHAKLRGVLIHSKAFPGWKDFGGFAAHMRFVREQHEQVARGAVLKDTPFAGILQSSGQDLLTSEVRRFY